MNSLHEHILVVEDDAQIRNFICFTLEAEAYVCVTAATAEEAMRLLAAEPIDLMLLDLGLPDLDGTEVIRRLRTWSEMPVIVVSARDQDKEKVAVLDLGADDYLTKPFSASELLARIRVALRHMYKQSGAKANPVYQAGELRLDAEKRKVYLGESEIHVTPMEYALLLLLFKNQGKVLTTSVILREIWGAGYGQDTQALRTLTAGLRRKIEKNPAKPRYILTEIGVGYRLAEERE
ncbi:MAG: response regulator transcription factor [Clostridiales bacterium]|nr:response regulator transcription factor [Clostridiales bacterium]